MALALLTALTAATIPVSFTCRSAPLSEPVRVREAAAISAAAHRPVAPRRIDYLLQSGDWKMIWTLPAQELRDVYLFHRTASGWRLIDRWHGDLGTDDPQAGLDWAAARHVPADLTSCFGTMLVNHP